MQKRMFNIKEKKPDNTDFFLFEDYETVRKSL